MSERRYYVCDAVKRVRLRGTHRTLEAALRRCQELNASEPGRYFCGDWCDVKIAMDYIDATREWSWEEPCAATDES